MDTIKLWTLSVRRQQCFWCSQPNNGASVTFLTLRRLRVSLRMNKCSSLDWRNSEETSETSVSLASQILHDSLSSLSGASKVRWLLHIKKDFGSNKHVEFYEVLVNAPVSNICLERRAGTSIIQSFLFIFPLWHTTTSEYDIFWNISHQSNKSRLIIAERMKRNWTLALSWHSNSNHGVAGRGEGDG